MTLREPKTLLPLPELGAVHFLAAGGIGMNPIAQAYLVAGVPVSGCDQAPSAALEYLESLGATVSVGHDSSHLDGVDSVVISTAVRETNPELRAARERGVRVLHRSEALASLMLGRRGVAVSGTHGKTTTTGMVATVVEHLDPGYVIGAKLATSGLAAKIGSGPMVVEADESDGTFWQYPADTVVITSIEPDHLDNWGDFDNYRRGFVRFGMGADVTSAVCAADDPGAAECAAKLRAEGQNVLTYGVDTASDLVISDQRFEQMNSWCTVTHEGESVQLALQVPGVHNQLNAVAAMGVGLNFGMTLAQSAVAMAGFRGTSRRFMHVADVADITIIDDYAHHPTEVAAALENGRRVAGNRRLVACFQPALFTRTAEHYAAFAAALEGADLIVCTDIYGSREDPIPGVTSDLISSATERDVIRCGDLAAATTVLVDVLQPGDFLMTIGSGSVGGLGKLVAEELGRS